jgi:hypothetical protein
MFQASSKLIKKRMQNLETWVNTTQQTVHYLNVNNQADNTTQLVLPNQTGTPLLANRLPTPLGSDAPTKYHCLGSR